MASDIASDGLAAVAAGAAAVAAAIVVFIDSIASDAVIVAVLANAEAGYFVDDAAVLAGCAVNTGASGIVSETIKLEW